MSAVEYSAQVKKAANFAIITALILIIAKGIAWWQTGSVSMLASITDSMLDLLASFMNMLILRFALMPADHNHSFGHGKGNPWLRSCKVRLFPVQRFSCYYKVYTVLIHRNP